MPKQSAKKSAKKAAAPRGSLIKRTIMKGRRILPTPLTGKESLAHVVDNAFNAYNSGRIREACRLFTTKMLEADVTVGMSLAGAMTPAGLGPALLVPLIEAGFVDWIVSTGANMYHDLHFALNYPLVNTSPTSDDRMLRENDLVRVYDVVFGFTDCLIATDEALRRILVQPEFQHDMGTAEMHYQMGRYAAEYERLNGLPHVSVLAAAHRCSVPIYTSSPGDSTIGMNIAATALDGNKLRIDPTIDVNESAAVVLDAKRRGGRSAVMVIGGGSPKNFMLQTEPQIQEILHLDETGHDYFLQVTDARPDTGGLSGATPSEAVSWGKIDPKMLPDSVVAYVDATIGLALITAYALERHKKRKLKRLYDRRKPAMESLLSQYAAGKKAGHGVGGKKSKA